MLVLRTLLLGPQHGYAIAKSLRDGSGETIAIEFGSLYPALKRLERRPAALAAAPDPIQQGVERVELAGRQHAHRGFVRPRQRIVQPGQQLQPSGGDKAFDHPAIGGGALAADEFPGDESVEQAADPGRLLDEAVGDLKGRQRGAPSAAENPQHVVLLQGNAFAVRKTIA